jgi:hypothetical protein
MAVERDVIGTNGATLPAGSTVAVEVGSTTDGTLALTPVQVTVAGMSYNLDGSITIEETETAKQGVGKRAVKGGAIGAAALGIGSKVFGKSTKTAVVAAVGGAAAGAAVGAVTAKKTTCVPAGGHLTLDLSHALHLNGS